ncbi:MAG: methionine--tRNA ligase [Candidatus Aenigmarchaeota archaeon]|nr:methionine--tRNA ligase [Candidatus Aenigmarchaeota archaeon]
MSEFKETFFISTAIDYPSSKPHLGHAYEKISTDVIARFKRLQGYDVHFSTGTDEHGIKMQRKAEEAGKSPGQFVDEMQEHFRGLCKALDISYDDFIRTTEQRHEKAVLAVYNAVKKRGDIYKGTYTGKYCVECETFYTDSEAPDGICPTHKKPLEIVEEESYFFRMGRYQKALIAHIKKNKSFIIPESRRNEILSRLEEPLHDLSISRKTFKWGIPLPDNSKHVMYVWMDALVNYLSSIGYPARAYRKYWPAVHVIGKDIVWHHTVIWGSILLSAGISLPKTVLVHGFVNVGGEKMSKSRGTVIDPVHIKKKYSSDYLRFFLAREIPFGEDGDFSEEALVDRVNNELIANYGNLFYRATHFAVQNFDGKIPKGKMGNDERYIASLMKKTKKSAEEHMENYRIDLALKDILNLASETNKYFQKKKPWAADRKDAASCIYTSLNALRTITLLLSPYIPDASAKALRALGTTPGRWKDADSFALKTGTKISAVMLFKKIDEEELRKKEKEVPVQAEKPERGSALTGGKYVKLEDFQRLDIRTGTVVDVKDHPNADKLLLLKVDIGGEVRQLVAGLKGIYDKKQLMGKQVVILANLEPAKLRGETSEGMLLACDDGTLLTPEKKVKDGLKVR